MAKICQSCAMPLAHDPDGGGTNADGSTSDVYCSYCYQNGAFTQPDITAKEMQAFCYDKIREMGQPKLIAWFFTRPIPKLARWR